MICSYIDEYKEDFGAEPICATLRVAGVKIAPSTYYARKHRRPSARKKRDEILKEEISRVHANNYDAFGARKMHIVLNREPDLQKRGHVARCTIERLMKDLRLHGIRRAKAPNTTRSGPRENCPADLVDRHFAAFAPDQLWVADITYVHWVGLRRVRHRRVQSRDRRLAGIEIAAYRVGS